MDKFRLILNEIQDCIEMQNGATESQLKTLWNDLSDAISENERGQNIDTRESQQLNIADVGGSYFEVDFGGHLKAQMIIENGKMKVTDAVNGWGDPVDVSTVRFFYNCR